MDGQPGGMGGDVLYVLYYEQLHVIGWMDSMVYIHRSLDE